MNKNKETQKIQKEPNSSNESLEAPHSTPTRKRSKLFYACVLMVVAIDSVILLFFLFQKKPLFRKSSVPLDFAENIDIVNTNSNSETNSNISANGNLNINSNTNSPLSINSNASINNTNQVFANANINLNANITVNANAPADINSNINTSVPTQGQAFQSTGMGMNINIISPYHLATGIQSSEDFFQAVTYDDTQIRDANAAGLKIEIALHDNLAGLPLLEWIAGQNTTDEPSLAFVDTMIGGKNALTRETLTQIDGSEIYYAQNGQHVYSISVYGDRASYDANLAASRAMIQSISFTQ